LTNCLNVTNSTCAKPSATQCVDVFVCVTWLIYMCDMNHSHVWHESGDLPTHRKCHTPINESCHAWIRHACVDAVCACVCVCVCVCEREKESQTERERGHTYVERKTTNICMRVNGARERDRCHTYVHTYL